MKAKIVAYNTVTAGGDCPDFAINTYWGNGYKNEFYLCGVTGRTTFDDTVETIQDARGQITRILNTSIERYNLTILANSYLLNFLKSIDKHETKELHILDTGEVYNIRNVDIEDDGGQLDAVQRVTISYELSPLTNSPDTDYEVADQKQAFWDNDNNGVKDLDGEAYFNASGVFSAWQLYYESDGITAATSGNVTMLVYAVKNDVEYLLGTFRGAFGDSFSDATKWQTTQSIQNYFSFSDTVGHTNEVIFWKEQFAKDNGYYSDETEDKAVKIRFDLSIDGSTFQPTTLEQVYSTFGAYNSAGVQQPSGEYGITTINKPDQKQTVSALNDVRTPLPSGTPVLVTSFVNVGGTSWTSKNQIDVAPAGEHSYQNSFTTNGGYVGESFRGANGANNFTFSLNEAAIIGQTENILNFVAGSTPYDINLSWKFDRVGTHSNIGTVVNGTAGIYLDGVLYAATATVVSGTTQVLGANVITLPDTNKHTIKLKVDTSNGYEIFTEFEAQIKPLY